MEKADKLSRFHTFRSCMSLFAPFFSRAIVASTLLTAAAQCKADLPERDGKRSVRLTLLTVIQQECLHQNKNKPTQFIHCIDISMTGDEFLYHTLNRQPCCQNQGRGAVIHSRVKICRPVSDKNLGKEKKQGWLSYNKSFMTIDGTATLYTPGMFVYLEYTLSI